MWISRKAIASSDTLRWTASRTKRGMCSVRRRRTLATPSATLNVSRIRATVPVPRVRYQYAVGLVVAAATSIGAWPAQEPPETTAGEEPADPDDDEGVCV